MLAAAIVVLVGGCRQVMMPTPVMYHDGRLDPFFNTPEDERSTTVEVFYATDRRPRGDVDDPRYSNDIGGTMRLGLATVRLGDEQFTWEQLREVSTGRARAHSVPLYLLDVTERATLGTTTEGWQPTDRDEPDRALTAPEQRFIDELNDELAGSVDHQLNIYVHGFNVNFDNPCLVTAELHHFMGATSVVMAYAWPSRQSSWLYASDVWRAHDAAPRFARLIEFLATHSEVEQINVLSYSAGTPLVAEALYLLRERYGDLEPAEIRRRLRIGRVIFSAATINLSEFRERYFYAVDEMAQQAVILINPRDLALVLANPFSLGQSKLGMGSFDRAKLEAIAERAHLHITDVSLGEAARHNDMFGHAYWYANPWVSSDVLAALRFRCPPEARGLTKLEDRPVWYFPEQYPDHITGILLERLAGP